MKRRALFFFFILWKSSKICNCRLLQIVSGTLWVNFSPIIVVCWLPLQNLEAATGPLLVAPFCMKWPLAKGKVGHHQHHANGQILDSVFHLKSHENDHWKFNGFNTEVGPNLDPKCLIMDDLFLQPVNNFSVMSVGSSVLNQYQSVSG